MHYGSEYGLEPSSSAGRGLRKMGLLRRSTGRRMGMYLEGTNILLLKRRKKKLLMTFPGFVNSPVEGYRVGKLFVSNKEIVKGSNGTVVLEGSYEGRLVAFKRLVQTHHDVAQKKILNLMASDKHPNIVR
ncbi:unnamed protein product [Arabis nemorensis]|uniref:non-specific serine/threonine protein kinase n=1 Tax=Arabis nemorensis TaxID=586526 RepID=A0A565CUY2_9BRAS|nr:unnamed protein product [Arabis nemorensis]